MKMNIKFLMLVAALPLVSFCSKEAANMKDDSFITIVAGQEGVKTTLNGPEDGKFTTTWTKGDALKVWRTYKGTTSTETSSALESDCAKASFQVAFSQLDGDQKYSAVYPASAAVKVDGIYALTIPTQQTAVGDSFDPQADVLIAGPVSKTGMVKELPMQFCRLGSIVRLEIDGLADGETVESVTMSSSTRLSGSYSWDPVTAQAVIRSDAVNSVTVNTSSNIVVARVMSGTHNNLNFTIKTSAGSYQKKTSGIVVLEENTVNCFTTKVSKEDHGSGSGTSDDPYLIYNIDDLQAMENRLVGGITTYFKLMADINMAGVNWSAPNQGGTFDLGIDFDGNNHTISNFTYNTTGQYAGFIGVLNGRVANLTFVNPSITATKAAGVVCGYAGTTGTANAVIENVNVVGGSVVQNGNAYSGLIFGTNAIAGTFTNCHTSGSVTVSSSAAIASTKAAVGGIAGSSQDSKFDKCSFAGTINSGRLAGGIVGYERGTGTINECWVDATINVTRINSVSGDVGGGIAGYFAMGSITNCYSKGSVSISDQFIGGITANVTTAGTVTNCWSSMSLKAQRGAGGIVGRASNDKWDPTLTKSLEIKNCVYWGNKIDVAPAGSSNGSSGAIVGFTSLNNVLQNCWRKADFEFVNTGNPVNKPVDQPDCDGTNWSKSADTTTGEATQIGTGSSPQQYLFPYWGKASDAASISATVSGKNLGWDSSIWDLSSDSPSLKNNPEI